MLREIIYAILGVVVFGYAAEFLLSLRDDPREPPRVNAKIPLIGHILGMIREGKLYYNSLGAKVQSDMYMISIFGFKIYVCNSYHLMGSIQKNAKTLSFKPFVKMSMKKNSDVSDHAYAIGDGVMTDKLEIAQRAALAPGPHLDDVTQRTAEAVLSELADLEESVATEKSKSVMLLAFLRHSIVQASAFRDIRTWHKFLPKMFMASFLASQGFKNRQIVFDAYKDYFKNLPDDASRVFRERQRVYTEAGLEEIDRIKLEAAWPLAIFSNTVPTAYWFLYELCSQPELLAEVRREVEAEALKRSEDDGSDGKKVIFEVDIAALRTRCRLLLAVLEETQRTRHIHASMRKVLEDTLLDDRYLLKKGYVVQMPGGPIHHNPNVYGASADQFDPHRFVVTSKGNAVNGSGNSESNGKGSNGPISSSSFLAWGAPPHLCPARQFAATELLLLASLLVLRFDIQPADGQPWAKQPPLKSGEIATLLSPKDDVAVQLVVRENWIGKWKVTFGANKSRVPLTSG